MKIVCLKCGYERISSDLCSNQLCHGPQVSFSQMLAERDRYREALERIGDATSAMKDGRTVSYADWELRLIAREALKEQSE